MEHKLTLTTMQSKYGKQPIPYHQLLQTSEWAGRRKEIIVRDGCKCARCQTAETEVIGAARDENGKYRHFFIEKVRKGNDEIVNSLELSPKGAVWFEVHHKFYIINRYPWDYPDSALITLCNWCHQEIHDTTVIPVLSYEGEALGYTPCSRCNGSGSFSEYSHVQSGVCFKCNGARYEELIDK